MTGQDTRTPEEKARGERALNEAIQRQHDAAAQGFNPLRPAPTNTPDERRAGFPRPATTTGDDPTGTR
jgi:hypothetical protein